MTKKTILGFIVLFISSNVLTTVWYLLTDAANFVPFRRDDINYWGMILNHLIFVAGFMYLFPFYIKEKNSKSGAFCFGTIMAAIMFIPTGLVIRSIWQIEMNLIFLMNVLAHLFIGGVLGIVLFIILNYKVNESN